MSLTITLPKPVEQHLQARATLAGENIGVFVQHLVCKELEAPLTLSEASEPLARAVDEAKLTDKQFLEILEDTRNQICN